MKACPACGLTEVTTRRWHEGEYHFGWCERCQMRGPRALSPQEAIAAWDALPRREDADAQKARAERLAAYARAREEVDKSATKRGADWATAWRANCVIADAAYAALQPGDVGETSEP